MYVKALALETNYIVSLAKKHLIPVPPRFSHPTSDKPQWKFSKHTAQYQLTDEAIRELRLAIRAHRREHRLPLPPSGGIIERRVTRLPGARPGKAGSHLGNFQTANLGSITPAMTTSYALTQGSQISNRRWASDGLVTLERRPSCCKRRYASAQDGGRRRPKPNRPARPHRTIREPAIIGSLAPGSRRSDRTGRCR